MRCSNSNRKINPNANSARQNTWKDRTKHSKVAKKLWNVHRNSKVAKNFPIIETLRITKILKTVKTRHHKNS